MAGNPIVAFDVGAGEGAAPDDVVPGAEGDFNLETVATRIVLDHGRAFPGGLGAAVVFDHHKCAVVQHPGPFRHEDGVEIQHFAYLFPADHDEEVGDGRRIEAQFRFRRCREVFDGTAFDPLSI